MSMSVEVLHVGGKKERGFVTSESMEGKGRW